MGVEEEVVAALAHEGEREGVEDVCADEADESGGVFGDGELGGDFACGGPVVDYTESKSAWGKERKEGEGRKRRRRGEGTYCNRWRGR